jgi:branched-subunit amino acid ABC-type transport system permease component
MLQILADGLIIGSVISLGAIGLSLTLSIVRFSNFSHGELLGWGSYVALSALAVFTATRESLATPLGPFTFGWARWSSRWQSPPCWRWRWTMRCSAACATRGRSLW